MSWIGNFVYNTVFGGSSMKAEYEPSIRDVLITKEALRLRSKLPYELIDDIVDLAELWPHTTSITSQPTRVPTRPGLEEDRFILRSFPVGYVPAAHNGHQQAQDFAFKNPDTYQTELPKPWPESRAFSAEMTQEVLSKWQLRSFAKSEHPCRKIVFTIKSHDQGWGGRAGQEGGYEGSYSWFEAGLERIKVCGQSQLRDSDSTTDAAYTIPLPHFEIDSEVPSSSSLCFESLFCTTQTIVPPTAPKQHPNQLEAFHFDSFAPSLNLTIQKNVVASRQTKEHKVTWSYNESVIPDSLNAVELSKQGRGPDSANGEFVRNLKLGDVVTVWAKARFSGWANHVESVRIDVYWVV